MQFKTHLSITLFFALILLSTIENKIVFISISLFATLIPDIDTSYSYLGKFKIFRFLQVFIKHRGFLHSFTFLLLIICPFALFLPFIALPLFLGYGLHLLTDSLTIEGIQPFYPYKRKIFGRIKTGGMTEIIIFSVFFLSDLVMILF